jgi:hypothetical protein
MKNFSKNQTISIPNFRHGRQMYLSIHPSCALYGREAATPSVSHELVVWDSKAHEQNKGVTFHVWNFWRIYSLGGSVLDYFRVVLLARPRLWCYSCRRTGLLIRLNLNMIYLLAPCHAAGCFCLPPSPNVENPLFATGRSLFLSNSEMSRFIDFFDIEPSRTFVPERK